MTLFVEMRCDGEGSPDGISQFSNEKCWSDENNGPWVHSDETVKSICLTLSEIKRDALRAGWVKRGRNWICPECAKREGLAK